MIKIKVMEQRQLKTNSRLQGVIQLFEFLKTKGYFGEFKNYSYGRI